MKKLTVTMWITLDGFIASSDGGMGWLLGDDEMSKYEIGVVSDADTLLLGRKTYEDFVGYWPHIADNPKAQDWERVFGKKLNAMHKIVVSKTLVKAEWGDSKIITELVASEIERLKSESERGVLIYGSASLVQQLTNLDLVDEYQLLVHPVVLGSGKRLFQDVHNTNLKLVESKVFSSGVVLLTYQPAKK